MDSCFKIRLAKSYFFFSDSRKLSDYNITAGCTIYMSSLLKGGVSCDLDLRFPEFVDVNNQAGLKAREWSKTGAPKWRLATPGLSLEGICSNLQCSAHGETVIMNMGYRSFDIVSDPSVETTKCPICNSYVGPETCAFNNCWWRWYGIKQKAKTEAPEKCSSDWKYSGNAYHCFDKQESGSVTWRRLVLEAVKNKPIG